MFISKRELKDLFAGPNQRRIDGGSELASGEFVDIAGTAVLLSPASPTKRRVIIQNSKKGDANSEVVAIGPETVTLLNGYLLHVDSGAEMAAKNGDGGVVVLFTKDAVYGIAGAAADVRVLVEAD